MAKPKAVEFGPAGPQTSGGFSKVTNEDGESDVRMNLKDAPEQDPPPSEPSAQADAKAVKFGTQTEQEKSQACTLALEQLKVLGKIVAPKKDDDLTRAPYSLHRVHIGMIREMAAWLDKGKKFSLSDGNCEMLGVVHAKLKKSGVLK